MRWEIYILRQDLPYSFVLLVCFCFCFFNSCFLFSFCLWHLFFPYSHRCCFGAPQLYSDTPATFFWNVSLFVTVHGADWWASFFHPGNELLFWTVGPQTCHMFSLIVFLFFFFSFSFLFLFFFFFLSLCFSILMVSILSSLWINAHPQCCRCLCVVSCQSYMCARCPCPTKKTWFLLLFVLKMRFFFLSLKTRDIYCHSLPILYWLLLWSGRSKPQLPTPA